MIRGIACVLLAATAFADEPVAVARLKQHAGLLGSAKAKKIVLEKGRAKVDLGGGKTMLVELRSKKNELWIDKDLDGDLGDERPLAVKPAGAAWNHAPSVEIGGKPLVLYFYLTANCQHDHLHFYPRMHRRGEAVLARRLRLVGVADPRFGGSIFVDRDGDGVLDEFDRVEPGKPFGIDGMGYTAKLVGDAVEFRADKSAPEPPPRPWRPLQLIAPKLDEPRGTLVDLKRIYGKERNKVPVQRYETLRRIGGLFSRDAFDFLLGVAGDAQEPVALRARAVSKLGHEKYLPHAKKLVAQLAGMPAMVGEQALLALHFMGYPGREAIYTRVLGQGTSLEMRGAAIGLALLGRGDLVRQAVAGAANNQARYYAYQALRYDPQGPPPDLLKAAAQDKYEVLRGYALQDMVKLGLPEARDAARRALDASPTSPVLVNTAIDVLGRAGDLSAVGALFRFARRAKPDQWARIRKETAPIRDPEVTAFCIKALRSKHAPERALAAALLAHVPDRKTTDALVRQAKKEKDAAAAEAMLEALGEHADPRSVAVLLGLAKRKDPALRVAAIRALARLGPGIPKVQAFFEKLLVSKNWVDRVYALEAAGNAGNAAATKRVVANLDHKVWQVRDAAAHALAKLRQRDAIGPLIARLQKEEHKRARASIAEALFKTTGMYFYDFADTWARWWSQHGATFKVPEKVPMKRKPRPGGSVASFYGLPLDSDRIVFVIDQSGSMSAADAQSGKNRLETAVAEVLGAVGRLKTRDKVNVILFESRIHPWRNSLVPLKAENRKALESFLLKLRPTGGTNLYDGLELAMLHKDVDTIFLLSDGSPGGGKFTSTPDILREVARLNATRRIAIHCVSIGTDSDLLQKLAAQNSGKYVRR